MAKKKNVRYLLLEDAGSLDVVKELPNYTEAQIAHKTEPARRVLVKVEDGGVYSWGRDGKFNKYQWKTATVDKFVKVMRKLGEYDRSSSN